MIKEEIWTIPIRRAGSFFREQAGVTEECENSFSFGSCRIQLTELPPIAAGMWAASRTQVRLEGEDADVKNIYHRFFLQFLSAGG